MWNLYHSLFSESFKKKQIRTKSQELRATVPLIVSSYLLNEKEKRFPKLKNKVILEFL